MANVNPLLLVGAVIGVVTALLVFAYASVKDKKGSMGFERNMADGEIVRRLIQYAKPYGGKFIIVGFLVLFSISYDIASPLIVGYIEELVVGDFTLDHLFASVAVYAGVLVFSMLSTYFQAVILQKVGQRIISDLLRQGAAIDLFGVGERLITASSEPVFGGVYKLAAVEENGVITPKIKISENVSKITNPHFKKLYRIYESNGKAIADQLCVYDETIDPSKPLTLFDPDFTWKKKTLTDFTVRELQVPVFKSGELVYDKPSLQDIRSYCKQQIDTLWDEVLRFENPHNYYVDLSRKLWDIKHELLDNGGVLRARDGRERS